MNENYDGMKSFSGSIDELLQQMMKLDPDAVEQQVEEEKYNMAMLEIMRGFECTYEEAESIFAEARMCMVQKEIEALIADGKVEVTGTDESGNLIYSSVKGS